jgi:plasmid stabilization system protein ParE
MRFTVVWSPDAESDLADIWIHADDRDAVSRASNELDRALAHDPNDQGESREEGVRITFAGPLGINFEVNAADRQARVIAVWRTRRRQ